MHTKQNSKMYLTRSTIKIWLKNLLQFHAPATSLNITTWDQYLLHILQTPTFKFSASAIQPNTNRKKCYHVLLSFDVKIKKLIDRKRFYILYSSIRGLISFDLVVCRVSDILSHGGLLRGRVEPTAAYRQHALHLEFSWAV